MRSKAVCLTVAIAGGVAFPFVMGGSMVLLLLGVNWLVSLDALRWLGYLLKGLMAIVCLAIFVVIPAMVIYEKCRSGSANSCL